MTVSRTLCTCTLTGFISGSAAMAGVESEGFDGGAFTNPFFVHTFEFDDSCCRGIVNHNGSFTLHLRPNTDTIAFDLEPGWHVEAFCVVLEDHEGGIVGDLPTSIVFAQGETGDFVTFAAEEIGQPLEICVSASTPGRVTGEPIGAIVQIQFQAANQGNDLTQEVGAFFDDLTATIRLRGDVDGDDVVGFSDLLRVLAAWGPCPKETECPEDVNGDGTVDLQDVLVILSNWG